LEFCNCALAVFLVRVNSWVLDRPKLANAKKHNFLVLAAICRFSAAIFLRQLQQVVMVVFLQFWRFVVAFSGFLVAQSNFQEKKRSKTQETRG
jgi:hypothetical protein